MYTLKLFLENDGKSWTLKPNQEHIMISGGNFITPMSDQAIGNQQLKFSFNTQTNFWYVYNLDKSIPTYL
ncbi:hypothetical protein [Aphanothece sacrum]|uniref:FHA domain-containing protein n=1 Tax=Aphanothece sacrum FPU1 TaxID=1920663 RepID=A0A401IL65_APHSA|nr:hypothetical protein [Aphanothece sacrum]GBF81994.1 FHA domain-containing protein [Aphanothece sacrum FPU1]GBF83624.1 FHA domain-containing protein [Aphanothece sacrum FPU3]